MEQNGGPGGVFPAVAAELGGDDSLDVFEEDKGGLAALDSLEDGGEEVAGVLVGVTLAAGTEGLTGEPARKDVHESVKLCEWEIPNVRPDRSCIQETRFHLCDQIRADERLSLTVSDCAQSWQNSSESEGKTFVSGTKGEVCNCEGSIHIEVI